jgi:chloramphenicol 3-O phosphotransferase
MSPDTLAGATARDMMRFRSSEGEVAKRIVLLNGTSSAGKTTIARNLQRTLEPRWLDLEFDLFVGLLTDEAPGSGSLPGSDLGHWLADGWYRVVGGLAEAGFNVLVEDVILEPYWLDAAIRHLSPFDVTFVAVRCPLEVAVQRETDRGDRDIGLVTRQFDSVHAGRSYDCEVDTSTMDTQACVDAILRVVEEGGVREFDVMRRERER